MRLALCIPTHDGRRDHLRELLESVLPQTSEVGFGVQVCVSDNASRDGTEQMMAELARDRDTDLSYRRNSSDLGAHRNILQAVAMADAEYCWTLGSDDLMPAGGVAEMLRLLDEHSGVTGVTVNHLSYDERMGQEVAALPPSALPADPERPARYRRFDEILRNVGIPWGDLTLNVVKKAAWTRAAEAEPDPVESSWYWAHVLVMGRMARHEPDWLWYPHVTMKSRSNRSSWVAELGGLARYHLEVSRDAERVWATLSARDRILYGEMMRKWYLFCATPRDLVHYKLQVGYDWRANLRMLAGFSRVFAALPEYWRRSLPVLLTPRPLLARSRWLQARLARP